jgi:LysM repeat protein
MGEPIKYDKAGSGGQPLDAGIRNYFESRMGYDFKDVHVHNNAEASRAANNLDALAYTQGNHIVFGEGQFRPDTDAGKQLLAHELTHTVQQKSGNTIYRKPKNFSGKVSNKKSDGAFDFMSIYQLNITDTEATITINLKLIPENGVSKQTLEDVKFQTRTEFLRYWDHRFTLTNPDGDKIPLRVKLNFVEEKADLEVHLQPGRSDKRTVKGNEVTITNETEDLEKWFVDSDPAVRAHELGHQLGMLDEYVDPWSPNRETEDSPGVFEKDHSLMNNPQDEGRQDVRMRHGNTLAADISGATKTQYKAGWSDTYIVNHGENMRMIALRIYGDANKWKDIYELNKKDIKNFTVHLGQVLKLPPIP